MWVTPYFSGQWPYWELRDKVTFIGEERLIVINPGITSLDFKTDVYSAWKNWVMTDENSKWDPALRVVGGDPIPGTGQSLGASFFLINGWHMRTWEGNHTLDVVGNIYTEDGSALFVPTIDSWNIILNVKTSNLIDKLDNGAVAGLVWDQLIAEHQLPASTGKSLKDSLKILKVLLANA